MKKYIKASSNSVSELAKFIKDSVNTLLTTDYTNSRYALDEDWAVYVGWSNAGYDENDDSIIHAEDDPKWVICVKIATAHEYAWYDFDWCDMPYNEETGDVWDTETAISPNEDYQWLASWLLKEYDKIVEEFGNEDDDYDDYDDEDYEYI
jgi:hypothetical protein